MEQQNNHSNSQNKDNHAAHSGGQSHGGRRSHHRPRGGRSGRRGGAGQDIKTKDGYYLNQPPEADSSKKSSGQGAARNDQRPRAEERKAAQDNRRGGSVTSGRGGADRSRERVSDARVQGQPVVATAPKDRYVSPTLARVEDRWMDDTFASLHEVEVHDAEAEAEASRILDAEGPLLFRDETVRETVAPVREEEKGETVEVVGIRFKSAGKKYYFAPGAHKLACGSYAIVETARGEEYGEVCQENTRVKRSEVVLPLRAVLRAATEQDTRHHEENKKKEDEAFRICQQRIAQHGLDMKLVEAQYTFDNSKLLFYFTSDGRVDFRELVKDLAGLFRTRIELRQIGIRDEAKLLGGLGTCGRPLCCYGFLSDFVQVSIKMAKEQNLSLNSNKISGCCGRLMCCLRYEFETYQNEIRLTPAVGTTVETPYGRGEVVANHPLKGTVTVRLSDKPEEPARVYHRDGVTSCRRGELERREKNELRDAKTSDDKTETASSTVEN